MDKVARLVIIPMSSVEARTGTSRVVMMEVMIR